MRLTDSEFQKADRLNPTIGLARETHKLEVSGISKPVRLAGSLSQP
jgi:hypothetical protein